MEKVIATRKHYRIFGFFLIETRNMISNRNTILNEWQQFFSLKGNQQKLQHNFSFVHIFQWITNAYDL